MPKNSKRIEGKNLFSYYPVNAKVNLRPSAEIMEHANRLMTESLKLSEVPGATPMQIYLYGIYAGLGWVLGDYGDNPPDWQRNGFEEMDINS